MPHETGTTWWDNLQTYVTDFFKGIQTYVDNLSPVPDDDNSMLPLASLPYKFDCTFYHTINTRSIIDGYTSWDKGYGYQPWLYAFRLNLTNNQLRVINQQWLGSKVLMGDPDRWGYLTNEDMETINAAGKAIIEGTPIVVDNSYPTNEIRISGGNYGNISFYPLNHSNSDIIYKFPTKDPNVTNNTGDSTMTCVTVEPPTFDENDGYWKPAHWGIYQTGGSDLNYSAYSKLIAVFNSVSEAEKIVNTIGQLPYNAHNDVINYTKAGSEYKLYYGDNYLIYALNDSKIYTYQDLFNGTKQATDAINANNPTATPIKTPTYNEVKYDETDDDHEIPMELNKFVPDTNGMVYYYELDKDDIWKVRAGLNAINIDPLVLKDVTKNLISYKCFAFDPATLIKTKTPVIVHIGGREIKYNDNSIPANYVEELNTINLGAITINKPFGDYRDYAPYTKLELFVPFCGWTTLPSWCMDKTITGEMFVDMWDGSCKAVIKANSTVVCELGGSCAYDVPFVADATGSKAAAILAKTATTAGAVATGNPLAIATSGIALATAMNANYTEMRGVCGDGSNINGLDRMYVKITRVSWTDPHKKARPNAYKHTYGIPCGKSLTLKQGDGFTQILDANIQGAMTAKEKQMIIDGFRHGLIL